MGGYIASAGGKRLRPILLLLAARVAGYRGPRGVRLACVVELLHTATLIHDDVVDQAPLRRGRPSANAQWGDDASLLVGDHLYSKSFAILVRDNDRAVMETLARSTVSMTEAEVFQLELKRSGFTSEADYLRIVTLKTASFMSACCRIGGLLGGLPPEQVEALAHYGLDIGVAFQISDDSLDFVADPERLGKAIGADLREGKRTLPLIAMLDQLSPPEAERVRAVLRRPSLVPAELEEIRRLVLEHDVVEGALALEAAAPFFPRGTVHVAVIDPGVGTARRGIAVAARDQVFIGPDNGVFTPFLSGRDWRAFELAVTAYRLPAVSRTFHGRDLFAPAAAHVAVGVDVARLGPALTDPVRLAWDRGRERAGTIEGAVIHVDRFGNLVTSLFADALRPGSVVRVAGRTIPVVGTYGDLPRGGLGALAGSSGRLEIAVREGSAAAVLRARRGTRVIVSRTSSSRTSSSGTSPSQTSPSQTSPSQTSP